MRVGKLKHLITIESLLTVCDSFGQATGMSAAFAQAWASIEVLDGGESFQGDVDQRRAQQTVVFETRFIANVIATMQIRHADQVYDIHNVAEIQWRKGLQISTTCQEQRLT